MYPYGELMWVKRKRKKMKHLWVVEKKEVGKKCKDANFRVNLES